MSLPPHLFEILQHALGMNRAGRRRVGEAMTREQLDALEALEAKATPGPWWAQREYDGGRTVCQMRHLGERVCLKKASHVGGDPWDAAWENANLVEALRNNAAALIAAAREALELREALEFAAGDRCSLYRAGDGYCCVLFEGGADVEKCIYGATPLEAIKKAREACDGAGKNQG